MGFGIEFSHHKRQSQSSGAVLGSSDASGNSSSQESTQSEEEGNGAGLGCFYRAIYSFAGTNEDEVHVDVYGSNVHIQVCVYTYGFVTTSR